MQNLFGLLAKFLSTEEQDVLLSGLGGLQASLCKYFYAMRNLKMLRTFFLPPENDVFQGQIQKKTSSDPIILRIGDSIFRIGRNHVS
jgi:hypothetical protein